MLQMAQPHMCVYVLNPENALLNVCCCSVGRMVLACLVLRRLAELTLMYVSIGVLHAIKR